MRSRNPQRMEDGLWNFEYLDQETDTLTESLEKYRLTVNVQQIGCEEGPVATLLPYDFKTWTERRETRPPTIWEKISTALSFRSKAQDKVFPEEVERNIRSAVSSLEEQQNRIDINEKIKSGELDGSCCSFSTKYVQDAIEGLVNLVKNFSGEPSKRSTYLAYVHPVYGVMQGGGYNFEADKKDTMSDYLKRGVLVGSKKDGLVLLEVRHPSRPSFSVERERFREAYHNLVSIIKGDLVARTNGMTSEKFEQVNDID